ncbi:MAG: hypothetical protein EAZ57_03285 [Cytophagales bacterium]|nr:MAG: hypothetical protein EAZ67_03750 [Cytophagales bacterium]TAF61487.1 MAG: hypothetical protein EAZ57_03285 [Cytophagales bacterium]
MKKLITGAFCSLLLFVYLQSCVVDTSSNKDGQAKEENYTEDTESTTAENEQASSKSSDLATQMVGMWLSHHEPYGYEFRADGTYDLVSSDPIHIEQSGSGIISKGTWQLSGDMLQLNDSQNGVEEPRKVSFLKGIMYFGEIQPFDPNCTECPYKSLEEYVTEMGLHKQK